MVKKSTSQKKGEKKSVSDPFCLSFEIYYSSPGWD